MRLSFKIRFIPLMGNYQFETGVVNLDFAEATEN